MIWCVCKNLYSDFIAIAGDWPVSLFKKFYKSVILGICQDETSNLHFSSACSKTLAWMVLVTQLTFAGFELKHQPLKLRVIKDKQSYQYSCNRLFYFLRRRFQTYIKFAYWELGSTVVETIWISASDFFCRWKRSFHTKVQEIENRWLIGLCKNYCKIYWFWIIFCSLFLQSNTFKIQICQEEMDITA